MAAPKGDFSKGKVSGLIVKLGLPIMLAELVHVLYNRTAKTPVRKKKPLF